MGCVVTHSAAYPSDEGLDPVDVAEEWVEVALQGQPWEARDADGQPPCVVQRGTDRDGDCQNFIEAELSCLDAAIIERLLEVARGES